MSTLFLNMRNMEYILTVVEEKNINKAAEKVHTSQPNLTKIIQKEESNIGLALFNKEENPWTLTYAGQLYVKSAKEILAANKDFFGKTDSIINEEHGLIRLGVMNFEERHIIPKLLPIVKSRCPDLNMTINLTTPFEITSLLYRNIVDFAIIVTEESIDIKHIPVKKYEILVAIPINHPLAEDYVKRGKNDGFPEIDLKLLADEPFLLKEGNKMAQKMNDVVCETFGFDLNKDFSVYSTDAALMAVEEGYGATFVLDTLAMERSSENKAAFFRIKGVDCSQEISLAYKKNKKLNSLEENFLDMIKNIKF